MRRYPTAGFPARRLKKPAKGPLTANVGKPVVAEDFEGFIDLPNGIAWKRAQVTAIKKWWMDDGDLKASHENASGFVTTVQFSEKGCVG